MNRENVTVMERNTKGGSIRVEVHICSDKIHRDDLQEAITILRQVADALNVELEAMNLGMSHSTLGLTKN